MNTKNVSDHAWIPVGRDDTGDELFECVDCGVKMDDWLEDPRECV